MSSRETFRPLLRLLMPEPRHKLRLLALCGLAIVLALLEAVGIGSIAPLVGLLQARDRPSASGPGSFLRWIDDAGEPQRLLFVLSAVILALFVLKTVIALLHAFLVQRYSQAFHTSLSVRLLESYMQMPLQKVVQSNSTVLIRNVIGETRLIVDHIVLQSLTIFSEGLVVLLVLAALFYMAPLAAGAISILTLTLLGLFAIITRLAGNHFGTEREAAEAELIKLAQSAITGMRELRLAGSAQDVVARFGVIANRYSRSATMVAFTNVLPRLALEALAMIAVLGALVALMLTGATSSLPTLAMLVGAGYRLLPALNRIYASGMMFFFVLPSLVKLAPSLARALDESERRRARGPVPSIRFEVLSAERISFGYEGSTLPVIVDASLEVRRGEMIGLIGASGAGKTTLINLLLGLITPQCGRIQVNGRQIVMPADVAAFEASVAYVAQSVFIADDTLLHNVTLGARTAQADRLEAVIRTAQLEKLVAELPSGLQTQIGERGARLSGGQIQRIGIARALYLDRPLLVLDEATSALDIETARAILEAIREGVSNKAVITVSHRRGALAGCTRIYNLQGGRLSQAVHLADP